MFTVKISAIISISFVCVSAYAQKLKIEPFQPPLVIIGKKTQVQVHATGGTPPYKFEFDVSDIPPGFAMYTVTNDGLLIADKTNEEIGSRNGGYELGSDSLSGSLQVVDATGSIARYGILGYELIDLPISQEKQWGYRPLGENHGIDEFLNVQDYLKVELQQKTLPNGISIVEQGPNYFHFSTTSLATNFTANYKYTVLKTSEPITGEFSVKYIGLRQPNSENIESVPALKWISLAFMSFGLLGAAILMRKDIAYNRIT